MLKEVNIGSQEASALIVVTQHYDTLQAIGANNKSNMVLLPNSPTAANQMLNDMIVAMAAAKNIEKDKKS